MKSEICLEANLDPALSPTRVGDYFRLCCWLWWSPQSLRHYIRRHGTKWRNVHWRNLNIMVGVVTATIVMGLVYLGLVALDIRDPRSQQASLKTGQVIVAYSLGVFAAVSVLVLLLAYQVLKVRYLVIAPTLYAFTLILGIGYSRWLKQPTLAVQDIISQYSVMGMFCGLMYSQLTAYRNHGLQYTRMVVVTAAVFGLSAAVAQIGARMIVPPGEYYSVYFADVVVAWLACAAGFLLIGPRFDNWLYAWAKTQLDTSNCIYPPHISYLSFPYLKQYLAKATTSDWNKMLQSAAKLWDHTLQHRVVAEAVYNSLEDTQHGPLEERLAAITSSAWPWKDEPIWFAYGGKRSTGQLIAGVTPDKALSKLVEDSAEPDPRNSHFFIVQVCRAAENIKDARQKIRELPKSSGQQAMRDLLDAMYELKGDGSFTGRRTIDSPLLPRAGVSVVLKTDNAWRKVDNLLSIYHYIWLATRCEVASHRDEGGAYIRLQLTDLDREVKSDGSTDYSVKKFLREIIKKWRDDVSLMLRQRDQFVPEPFNREEMVANPFEYDDPLRERTRLVGRHSQLRDLSEAWSGTRMQVVEITAPVLCGSTSLFLTVANSLRSSDGWASSGHGRAFAHVCIGHLTSSAQAMSQVADGLYDELQRYLPDPPLKSEVNGEPIRVLEFMIRKICEERTLVVGFDDIDRLERVVQEREDLRRLLRFIFHLSEILPQFGVALIGAFARANIYQELRAQTTRFAKPIELGAIGSINHRSVVAELLNKPVANFLPRFTPNAVEEVLKLSGGVPYLVQLIAWNIYEQVSDNDDPDPDVRRQSVRRWDPLITTDAVSEVLSLDTFRVGWEHYVRRLEEYFEDDWDAAFQVLDRLTASNGQPIRPNDFAPTYPGEATIGPMRARLVLDTLRDQRVVMERQRGMYQLRVGLMDANLLEQRLGYAPGQAP